LKKGAHMSSFASPFRNFSENHIRKQLSYCFFSSLQFSPILFIEIPENVNNSWWITNYIKYNTINYFIKYWTLRNVITCNLILTLWNPMHEFLFRPLIIRMCWKTSNEKDILFRHKIMNLIQKAGYLNFQTKLWALYRTYLNPTITKEFHR
jgi:hypothetical protein